MDAQWLPIHHCLFIKRPGQGFDTIASHVQALGQCAQRLKKNYPDKQLLEVEDTAIAGLSMGGYGALRNGLKYHETFGWVLPLSAGMMGPESVTDEVSKARFEARYGPMEKWEESDTNPRFLAKSLLDSGAELPKLYIACGWNDRLCVTNREYHHYLEEIGFPHVYEEGPGSHEWATWRWALPRALDFCSWLGPDTFENPFYCEMRDERYVGAPWKEEG